FLDGDMGHRRRCLGAVPMLLTGRRPDHVARPNLLDPARPAPVPSPHPPAPAQPPPPARISSPGLPQHCTQPQPAVTISVWPSGCVCQLLRAPGSKVTEAPDARPGSGALNNGSTRTVPVNQSAGPLFDACAPLRLISIVGLRYRGSSRRVVGRTSAF